MNLDRGIKKIGQRLFLDHDQEQLAIHEWMKSNPIAARAVVKEAAKVLMLAKCLQASPDDANFYSECAELVTLSFVYSGAKPFFEVVSSIDLAAHTSDRMVDPSMLGLIKERVSHLLCCLR